MEILIYIVSFWLGILAYYFLKLMYTIALNGRILVVSIKKELLMICQKMRKQDINLKLNIYQKVYEDN
jgi:hypothetical protein